MIMLELLWWVLMCLILSIAGYRESLERFVRMILASLPILRLSEASISLVTVVVEWFIRTIA